nr:7-cyano-7-deazaguanine synthase QueC [Actinoalloteichus hoggarensis]
MVAVFAEAYMLRPPRHAVLVASGGLDSTVLAYWLVACNSEVTMLSFDYGQRHRIELRHAAGIADLLAVEHQVVDLTSLASLLSGSALTDEAVTVPDGHYTEESMKATVVPNRNAIMLAVAVGLAVVRQADAVAFGAHAGDHTVYPDCRPAFVERFTEAARRGNEGFLPENFTVLAPFLSQSKTDIVKLGAALGVPFGKTWSCYRGATVHCGTCGTCVERAEAFAFAGVADPTCYAAGRCEE